MRHSLDIARIYLTDLNRRQAYLLAFVGTLVLATMPRLVVSFGMDGFVRVTKDLGLTLLCLFSLAASLFLGATAVPSDIERRTLYPLLSRPMRRFDYLLGKFLGVAVAVGVSVGLMASGLFTGSALALHDVDLQILLGAMVVLLQALVMIGLTLFFSTFCSPIVAGVLAYFTYFLGGLSDLYVQWFLDRPGGSAVSMAVRAARNLLPNFELFAVKNAVVHGEVLRLGYVAAVALYAMAWTALLLAMSGRAFERRDL